MRPTFSDQIRIAIQDSGISRYEISKRTGIAQAALSRFMNRQNGLNTDTLDRLALELVLIVEKTIEKKTPHSDAGSKGVSFSVEKRTVAYARKRVRKNQGKTSRLTSLGIAESAAS